MGKMKVNLLSTSLMDLRNSDKKIESALLVIGN